MRRTSGPRTGQPTPDPAPRLANDSQELRCLCGSERIAHVKRRRPQLGFSRAVREWCNLCLDCGDLSDYVPTRAEIAATCAALGSERTGPVEVEAYKAAAQALAWCPNCRCKVEAPCRLCGLQAAPAETLRPIPDTIDEQTAARLGQWIAELNLPVRLVNELEEHGIYRVYDLLTTTPAELNQVRFVGEETRGMISQALACLGFVSTSGAFQ